MSGAGADFDRLVGLIARLRGPNGCPWDRQQTFASIKPYTLEETYEVLQAIDAEDWPALADELGDLLLQILLYAQMAAEQRNFAIADVLRGLEAKLVRRHPHVFASAGGPPLDAAGVNQQWERIKQDERRAAGTASSQAGSLLGADRPALPALIAAHQMSVRAAQAGFEWPDAAAVLDKLEEEIRELRAELVELAPTAARVRAEVGDLLFTAANVARRLGCEPETALRAANQKFRRRFTAMETRLAAAGGSVDTATPAELDAAWEAVKREEDR